MQPHDSDGSPFPHLVSQHWYLEAQVCLFIPYHVPASQCGNMGTPVCILVVSQNHHVWPRYAHEFTCHVPELPHDRTHLFICAPCLSTILCNTGTCKHMCHVLALSQCDGCDHYARSHASHVPVISPGVGMYFYTKTVSLYQHCGNVCSHS